MFHLLINPVKNMILDDFEFTKSKVKVKGYILDQLCKTVLFNMTFLMDSHICS